MVAAHDRRYLAWLHALPCAVCGTRPVHAHHVRVLGGRRDDRRAVPLCPLHHLWDGPESVHRLGRRGFEQRHGIDFEALIARLNEVYATCCN
jgi:hypothetical protein